MDLATVQHWLGLFLALGFGIGGLVNIAGPAGIRQAYRGWGYPDRFNYVAGMLDVAAAGLLAWGPGRAYGAALALIITLAAFATLARHGEWRKTPGSILFVVLLAILLV